MRDCCAGARNDEAFSRRVGARVLLQEKEKTPDPIPSDGRRRWDRLHLDRARRMKSGRRNADRRVCPTSAPATFILPACGGGQRRGRGARPAGALACRRSTAALAAANQRRRSAPARASWDAADIRRYLKRACPSPASSSQTGHGAGRAFCRSRPGTAVTSRRPREPHSPRPPASPGCHPVS
jgi:hypothetical protein